MADQDGVGESGTLPPAWQTWQADVGTYLDAMAEVIAAARLVQVAHGDAEIARSDREYVSGLWAQDWDSPEDSAYDE